MGLTKWSQQELKILKANYWTSTKTEILRLIPDKSLAAIYLKANRLGLSKSSAAVSRSHAESGNSGESHPNWRGGVTIKKGYRYVLRKDHPSADCYGYVAEHRLVAEAVTGRLLNKSEHVHHINGDIADNRPDNLTVLSLSEHTVLHHAGAKRSDMTRKRISEAKKQANARTEVEITPCDT